jgi:hypothetical protein
MPKPRTPRFCSEYADRNACQVLQCPGEDRRLGRFATVVLTEDIKVSPWRHRASN